MSLNRTLPVRLDFRGADIGTIEEFYDQVVIQLQPPPHFGRNLDALWDLLATDVPGPLEIQWHDLDLSRQRLGDAMTDIEILMAELAEERDDVKLVFK